MRLNAIAMRPATIPGYVLIAVACLALAGGCARMPATGVTSLKPATLSALRETVLEAKTGVDQFRLRGPFEVTTRNNIELRLSATERYAADLYVSAPAEKAPLVILLHGYDNTKEDHAYQALHLATWGMHSLAVQLPGTGPWVDNGKAIARIVAFIHRRPELVDARIDVDRIILVGHSFGGAAVAIALAEGAPAAGGVLLDAAGIGNELPAYLRKVAKPVMLLGADEYVTTTRGRSDFFYYIRKNVAEISIRDAHHDDAVFPLEPAPPAPGDEAGATEELQITFVSALTASAMSLGFTGNLDLAWASFREAFETGKFFNAVKK